MFFLTLTKFAACESEESDFVVKSVFKLNYVSNSSTGDFISGWIEQYGNIEESSVTI